MNTKYYDRYKSILKKLNYRYKGYDLASLIPGYLTSVFSDDPLSVRDVVKEFYLSTKLFDLREITKSNTSTVISFLIKRSDYKELALSTQQSYPSSKVINIESLPRTKQSPLSFSFIKHLFKAFRLVFFCSLKEPFLAKWFYVAVITKIFNYIEYLEKTKPAKRLHTYICFNAAYKEESILTRYFQKQKIETITMQHGIFCDFKSIIPFDCINFENLIADKVLCWGQSTIDYLSSKGIEQSRLILAGNLKYTDIEIEQVDQSFSRCLVLLGRQIYIHSNNRLLNLLKTYNQQAETKILFYIKKHPFLMDEDHKEFASIEDGMIFLGKEHSVREVLNSDLVNFSIAVNTTAYYESLTLGKISLRWSEEENEDFYGMDDKFIDFDGLCNQLNKMKMIPQDDLVTEVKKVIRYVFNPNLK